MHTHANAAFYLRFLYAVFSGRKTRFSHALSYKLGKHRQQHGGWLVENYSVLKSDASIFFLTAV